MTMTTTKNARTPRKHRGIEDLWERLGKAEQDARRSRGEKRYKVRYTKTDGSRGSQSFATVKQAQMFQAQQRLDPQQAASRMSRRATVADVMDRWLALKGDKVPSTRKAYRLVAQHVVRMWGDELAANVDEYEVQLWSQREGLSSSVRRRQVTAMKSAFKLATRGRSRLLMSNPLADLPLPQKMPSQRHYLNWHQLEDLAEAMGEYGGMIYVLGLCGLRLEEACRLDVSDIDWDNRRLHVRYSKTEAGRDRWVGFDAEVAKLLSTDPGPLFRSPRGERVDGHNWRERKFKPVAEKLFDFPLVPHGLRHTAASLAIDAGADAAEVADMLGHADAGFTYRLYIHLFKARTNEVADTMLVRRQAARAQRHLRLVC